MRRRGYTTGTLTVDELAAIVTGLARIAEAWYAFGQPRFEISATRGWSDDEFWAGYEIYFPRSLWERLRTRATDGDTLARIMEQG